MVPEDDLIAFYDALWCDWQAAERVAVENVSARVVDQHVGCKCAKRLLHVPERQTYMYGRTVLL